jgi:hypothetical protein
MSAMSLVENIGWCGVSSLQSTCCRRKDGEIAKEHLCVNNLRRCMVLATRWYLKLCCLYESSHFHLYKVVIVILYITK